MTKPNREEAVKILKKAIDIVGHSTDVIGPSGDITQGLLLLYSVIDFDPEFAEAWAWIGNFGRRAGHTKDALTCINRALKLDPNLYSGLFFKGLLMRDKGKYYKAAVLFNKALQVNPSDNQARKSIESVLGYLSESQKKKLSKDYSEINSKKIKIDKKQKERLKKALGPMSDKALEGTMDYLAGYEQTQNENLEKAKILLGEDYVNKSLEENPNASHSFHFPEPYASMSLEQLRLMKKGEQKEEELNEGSLENVAKDLAAQSMQGFVSDFLSSVMNGTPQVEEKKEVIVLGKPKATKKIKLVPEKAVEKDGQTIIYDYLKENQGKFFSFKDLMDIFLEDPNNFEEKRYWRKIIRKVSVLARHYESTGQFFSIQLVNSIQQDGQTYYFIPDQEALECYLEGIKLHEPPLGYKKKEIKESIKHFNRAVELEPNYVYAWNWLGHSYWDLKDFKNALKYVNKALELDPHSIHNWGDKTVYLVKLNRIEEAFLCCNEGRKLILINKILFKNRLAGGFVYHINNVLKTKKDREVFLITIQQEIKELLIEAEKLNYSGDFEETIVLCDNVLGKDPLSALGWFWKGKALSALARDDEAVICYNISNDLKTSKS